jgi:hypothetical protein
VAAGWERAESTVTRTLFLVVFLVGLVAQFVKPVGDALEGKVYLGGALLCLVGYVLYAEVQRLNAGLEQYARPRVAALVRPRDLDPHFKEALEARGEVHIAILGFTGETVVEALKNILWDLSELSANERRSVHLRFLVPDFTKPIEIPGRVGADGKVADAPAFRRDLLRQVRQHEEKLTEEKHRMRENRRGALSVEFRVIHMSPSLKLYLINNDVVFEGIYDKIALRNDARRADDSGEPGEGGGQRVDPQGYESLLTRWHWSDGEDARTNIVRRRAYFETLWHVAHDLSEVVAARPGPGAS